MKPETAIIAAILAGVNQSGEAVLWRNQSGVVRVRRGMMHLAPAGSPDIVGWTLRGARFVGLEVKVPGAKTDGDRAAKQAEWRARILAAGGIAAQVTSLAEALAAVRGEAMPSAPAPRRRAHAPLRGEQLLLIGSSP